jgi:betaine reductase
MTKPFRVVHYLNQFFGGIGAEEKASVGPQIRDGAVGPAMAVKNALKGRGDVIATVICGDNYFTERTDEVVPEIIEWLRPYRPDLLIAGPAFNAGRYGVACGALCKAVQEKLGIPAVTGMYKENPGVGLYKKDVYIVKTAQSGAGMADAISNMVNLAIKLATKEDIGKPDAEGYFARGFLKREFSNRTAAQRVVDMLVAKLQGKPFETELHIPEFEPIKPAALLKNLSAARIGLVTDGGLIPKGNPDNIESSHATKYGKYDIKSMEKLKPENFDVAHVGYDSLAVRRDPNRLVPLDVMRELEKEGVIGKLNESFYSTTGVATTMENSRRIGKEIAERLKADGVDAVILTST